VSFDTSLIIRAIEKAFCAERGFENVDQLDAELRAEISVMTDSVIEELQEQAGGSDGISVEVIQDTVEKELMRGEHFAVARRYILYRAEHSKIRQLRAEENMESDQAFPSMMVKRDGQLEDLNFGRLRDQVDAACDGLNTTCSSDELIEEVQKQFFNGITPKEIGRSMVLAARARIEKDPEYDTVAGRLVLNIIYRESLGKSSTNDNLAELYRDNFASYVQEGIDAERLAENMKSYEFANDLRSLLVAHRRPSL